LTHVKQNTRNYLNTFMRPIASS